MDQTDLLLNQAVENERTGDWAAAEIFYRGLLKDHPRHPAATLGLGRLLLRRGVLPEAGGFLSQAAESDPASVEAHMQLGSLWQAWGQSEKALQAFVIAACLQGVAIKPDDLQARFQLALAFHRADRHREAAGAYRQALALQPDFAELHNNLGISLQNLLRPDAAATAHRRAVALAPGNAGHHCNLAHALLAAGRLAEGFAEWEWRTPSPPRAFTQAKWDGTAFPGKVLLAHAEQGYGDTLQFCRYLPAAARRGGRLVVECRAPLAGLLRRIPGVAEVIEWGQPLPAFDLQIAIPSLPFALGIDSATLAEASPPYLEASAARLPVWRQRIGGIGDGSLKVGLVWSGNAAGLDPKRAIAAERLAGLAEIPHVTFFSLQRDADAAAIAARTAAGRLIDLGSGIADFDDLAAAIECLDLLISVDTAAAHMAGALGKPVWTLLHASPDWRWQPEDAITPWYPSMRLYRQSAPDDWTGVMERVTGDLASLTAGPLLTF